MIINHSYELKVTQNQQVTLNQVIGLHVVSIFSVAINVTVTTKMSKK